MTAQRYQVVAGATIPEATYLGFAKSAFGGAAYQGLPAYLRWLYDESPLSRGRDRDFHLAVTAEGDVAGCIHVLRTTWALRNDIIVVPSPHNTIVLPEHRSGAGGLLIARALRGEPHVFIPGAVGEVASLLKRLDFVEAPTEWRSRWLRPLAAAVRLGYYRASGRALSFTRRDLVEDVSSGARGGLRWRVESPANAGELSEIVSFANDCWSDRVFAQYWTSDVYFWRFFHPLGPRHSLLTARRGGQLAGYVVLSLGMHHGLMVARVIDARHVTDADFHELMRMAAAHARARGAHLLLAMCGETRQRNLLGATGWASWKRAPLTLVKHRGDEVGQGDSAFSASAGDYGLEALVV